MIADFRVLPYAQLVKLTSKLGKSPAADRVPNRSGQVPTAP